MDTLAVRRGCSAGVARRTTLLFAALCALSRAAQAGEPGPDFIGRVDPLLKSAITRAYALALGRLQNERCLQIFSEFNDDSGRSLTANLEALHQTAEAQLASIRFADGTQQRACANPGVFAYTHLRTSTIYVCGYRFASLARTNPVVAAAVILHEQLHSLGLGENPPASREITASVMRNCGP